MAEGGSPAGEDAVRAAQEGEEEKGGEQRSEGAAGRPAKKKKKGKKDKEKKTGATGPPAVVSETPPISAKNLQEILQKLSVDEKQQAHDFWDSQPVPKLDEKVVEMGPMEPDRDEVRLDPLTLPDKFIWDDINLSDDAQLLELYTLLCENYVEDEDNMFRFDYSQGFLKWALQPPGWKQSWHCGVRVASNRKLVGFISAVPAHIRIKAHEQLMVEINFLCVHKKLRSKRVAPVLIKEITRRVNLEGIFQAVYTAGILLPKPIAVCRYWHRSLNPKKLVEVQFSAIHRNMTLQRMMRLYRLPDAAKTVGLRPMEPKDVPKVLWLVNEYLSRFEFVPQFQTEEEVAWWFLPRPDIVSCYVVENPETHEVTDFVSFYHLPSTVVHHPTHKFLNVAYSFYHGGTATPLKDLMQDALILAKKLGADVFNALDVMENLSFLEDLKFGIGDGNLHYYFYNWKCPEVTPDKVGLVLQ